MNPVDLEVIQRKLTSMSENLELLRPIAELSFRQYQERVYYKKAAERLLQTIIEAAIDINNHLLVGSGFPAAEDSYQSFLDVAQKVGALDLALAEELAPSAGLRNRLVHEYERLDDAIVFTSVRRILDQYPRYMEAVLQYTAALEKSNAGDETSPRVAKT